MELTNNLKDQFIADMYDGLKPTIVDYIQRYPEMDIDEFIDWGLAFAMLWMMPD